MRARRLYAAFLLAASTGMRRGEVLGLRWRDLDLEHARLSVSQTLVGEGQLSSPKTEKGRRSVALDSGTVEALRVHRRQQAEERLAFGPDYQDAGLVFCREDGSWLSPNAFSQTFDRLVRSSRLPRIRFHDLRHTHATLALQAGYPPEGGVGTAGPLHRLDHARHLQPRDPGNAGICGRAGGPAGALRAARWLSVTR